MAKNDTLRQEQIRQVRKQLNELPTKNDKKTREKATGIPEKDFRKASRKAIRRRNSA